MTTNNHTAMALSIALLTQNSATPEKVGILAALAISHLVTDAIPHDHYYDFAKFRQTWLGAIIELGIGLVALPLIIWYVTSASIFWLFGCTLSASLFDFGVAAGIKVVKRINHFVHWWAKNLTSHSAWQWELAQTVTLLSILAFVVFKYG
ncbi:MAG: hypothetical protein M1429_00410 [Patescibacteria group bacterium]|nr:hypothetical protein [Patescibacteria group bacterium]